MFIHKHYVLLPFLFALLLLASPYSSENRDLLSAQTLYDTIAENHFDTNNLTPPLKSKAPLHHKNHKSHHSPHDEEEWELILEEEANDGFENDDEDDFKMTKKRA